MCTERYIYQMWQHFAECGIALCTTHNINVRFFNLKICAYLYPYAKYTSRADIQNILIEYMSGGGGNLCEMVNLSLHLRGFDDLARYLIVIYFFVNRDSSSVLAFVSSKKKRFLWYDFWPISYHLRTFN